MQRVLFVISSIVVLGVGAIFYIKSDARPLSDDTVFPYISSSADEVDVYKISYIQAVSDKADQVVYKNKTQSDKVGHKNNSIQAISDKDDVYKSSNNQVVSDKVDQIVYKNKTQSDKVDVYKSSNNQGVSDKVDQGDVYKNNSGLPSSTNKMICKSSTSYDHLSVAPRYTLPIRMNTKWVCDLYHEVKQMQSKQLTLLICNKSYLEVLVNWLAQAVLHAHHPADNILIIAPDSFTHQVMQHKGIHSVFISADAVFDPLKVPGIASRIWMTKLTVIRLLNHWNYNVLAFDTDALMLKNVQPLLDKFSTSDIVASSGTYPFECSKKWKAPTMCMGAILYKSSPATGSFVI